MKQELTKEDIYFLARAKKIEVDTLLKVKSLLDPKRVRSTLIRYEYRERSKLKGVGKGDVVNLLMKRYNVSSSTIETDIYERPSDVRQKECLQCGRMTSYYRWVKYNGLCKKCIK